MPLIADNRLALLRGLVKTLPQTALRSLETALGLTNDQKMVEVRELISSEMECRHVKDAVFAPYLPMFQDRADGLEGVQFERWILDNLWSALESREPELHAEARYVLRGLRTEDPTPVVFFRLVNAAAGIIRETPELALRRNATDDDREELAEFAKYLDLHRLSRQVLSRLYDFMGRIDADKAAALRVLFKDAAAIDEEGGYRFLEIIFANLEDGAQIIKFVATVSDRPKDRFLAESELADFGTRILDQIENSLVSLKAFMGNRNAACNLDEAGDRVALCLAQLQSFGHYIELAREGPWGKRVAEAHKIISELVETQLKTAERSVEDVLPFRSERIYGRIKREVPDFTKTLPAEAVAKARQTLVFMRKIRNIANAGGFAALHSKVAQAIEIRLDAYFTELLALANGEDPFDTEQLFGLFELVSDLMQALCGEDKGAVARRRMASSNLFNPSKSPA
ncbi:hypothetical protein [Asticcacaulis sp. 201]|uniref:hypothetical protein n=1 Tax=Asticcacaulis sp. 201 TaxID=3028787 RepID=UPI002916BAF9|nr:hypothetical protein [Asticcacaulis sp. 201]MDV6331912.1 hypothetical protein [Asticcacaulis sp. 201]